MRFFLTIIGGSMLFLCPDYYCFDENGQQMECPELSATPTPEPEILPTPEPTEPPGPCDGLEGDDLMSCYCSQMGLEFVEGSGCAMALTPTPEPEETEIIDDPTIP